MPARLPTELKKLTGTHQPCRDAKDAPPATGLSPITHPEIIEGDDLAIQRYYQIAAHVVEMGVVSQEDDFAMAILAMRICEIERANAVIRIHGTTYQTTTQAGDVMFRARPEVAMRADAMRQAQSLLGEFGLTPAARSKVSAKAGSLDDPFGAF